MRNKKQEKLANDQHIKDLQSRLDMVARNASAKKRQIRSTMPYDVVANREAKRQDKLNKEQFGSLRSSVTGKSLTYLKDGEYLPR